MAALLARYQASGTSQRSTSGNAQSVEQQRLSASLERLDGATTTEALRNASSFDVERLYKNVEAYHEQILIENALHDAGLGLERLQRIYERLAGRRATIEDELEAARRAEADRVAAEAAQETRQNDGGDEEKQALKHEDEREALLGKTTSSDPEKSGEEVLQDQRQTQERITEDLLDMARALRQSQQAFGASMEKDDALIELASEALNRNVGKMTTTGQRLGKYSKESSSTTWLSLGAIGIVFAAIFIMIPIIKLT